MKLVDILARELKEWPNGCTDAHQSNVDTEVYFYPDTYGADFYATEQAEDYIEANVTKDQWVNAVDALKKVSVEPWNGEGLPPVGTVCEYAHPGDGFDVCRIEAYIKDKVVFTCPNYSIDPDAVFMTGADDPEFRPIRTLEQIAAEKYEADAAELAEVMTGHRDRSKDCFLHIAKVVLDAGYRKQEDK